MRGMGSCAVATDSVPVMPKCICNGWISASVYRQSLVVWMHPVTVRRVFF